MRSEVAATSSMTCLTSAEASSAPSPLGSAPTRTRRERSRATTVTRTSARSSAKDSRRYLVSSSPKSGMATKVMPLRGGVDGAGGEGARRDLAADVEEQRRRRGRDAGARAGRSDPHHRSRVGAGDGVDARAIGRRVVADIDAGGGALGLGRVHGGAAVRVRERRRAASVAPVGAADVGDAAGQAAQAVVGGAAEGAGDGELGVVEAGEGASAVGGGGHARLDARAGGIVGLGAVAARAAASVAARAAASAATVGTAAAAARGAAAVAPVAAAGVVAAAGAHVGAADDERADEDREPFEHGWNIR